MQHPLFKGLRVKFPITSRNLPADDNAHDMLALFLALDPKFDCVPSCRQDTSQRLDRLILPARMRSMSSLVRAAALCRNSTANPPLIAYAPRRPSASAQFRTSRKAAAETRRIARDGATSRSLASAVTSFLQLALTDDFRLIHHRSPHHSSLPSWCLAVANRKGGA